MKHCEFFFDNIIGGDALSSALCTQIEFYFSKENLARDPYLVSQMDAQLFVPISVIASVCNDNLRQFHRADVPKV